MRLVELSRGEHAGLRIRADLVEASAASQHLIPIVVSEFRKAATQYPIVFAKHPETGRFAPYVLTGLGIEENLFWSGTELDVAYVPLNVRRQPFYVGMSDGSDAPAANVLCIDLDSPCLDGSGGNRIVNADGSDSSYLGDYCPSWVSWLRAKRRLSNSLRPCSRWICWLPSCSTSCWMTEHPCKSQALRTR